MYHFCKTWLSVKTSHIIVMCPAQKNIECSRFSALLLSQRTSTAAFETKIKIKIQFDELEEALELLKEWRIIDPEVGFDDSEQPAGEVGYYFHVILPIIV